MYKIKKAVATAEAGRRVVMVVQEAPQEGEQKSRRAYQNLSNAEVAVDAVLFFPSGTIAFGHAAGWANATEGRPTPTRTLGQGGRATPSARRDAANRECSAATPD